MEQEDQELQAAQERLKARRQEAGVSETVHPIRSIMRQSQSDPADLLRCQKHGVERPCQACLDAEREQVRKDQALAAENEKRIREYRESERRRLFDHPEHDLETAGVPKRYLSYSLETFVGYEGVKKTCRDFAKAPGIGLLLYGRTGCGKTHLGVAVLREIVRTGGKGAWVTVPEMLLFIRRAFGTGSDRTEADIVSEWAGKPFLVLDDLGAEKDSEHALTTLYIIIDRRNREGFPTAVTTNYTPEEIEAQLGARIASRLADMQTVSLMKLPDYRKRRSS